MPSDRTDQLDRAAAMAEAVYSTYYACADASYLDRGPATDHFVCDHRPPAGSLSQTWERAHLQHHFALALAELDLDSTPADHRRHQVGTRLIWTDPHLGTEHAITVRQSPDPGTWYAASDDGECWYQAPINRPLITDELRLDPQMACKLCGCTEDQACAGGCSWVEPELCSACVERFAVVTRLELIPAKLRDVDLAPASDRVLDLCRRAASVQDALGPPLAGVQSFDRTTLDDRDFAKVATFAMIGRTVVLAHMAADLAALFDGPKVLGAAGVRLTGLSDADPETS